MGWRSALGRVVRNLLVVTVATVAAFGLFGYLVGGTAGVRGGVLWGLVAGGLSIPGRTDGNGRRSGWRRLRGGARCLG